jgi:putative tricarboxylic transport membrane protein
MTTQPALPELGVGLGMLALAGIVGSATAAIPQSTYAMVGPAIVPWAITVGLAIAGLLLSVQAFRGGWEHAGGTGLDLRSLAWLGAGLLLNLALIDGVSLGERVLLPPAGFIIASTAMFTCTARAFGSDKPVRDGAIGFALAIVAYLGFDRVLGYKIGSGLIESLI